MKKLTVIFLLFNVLLNAQELDTTAKWNMDLGFNVGHFDNERIFGLSFSGGFVGPKNHHMFVSLSRHRNYASELYKINITQSLSFNYGYRIPFDDAALSFSVGGGLFKYRIFTSVNDEMTLFNDFQGKMIYSFVIPIQAKFHFGAPKSKINWYVGANAEISEIIVFGSKVGVNFGKL